MVGMSDLLVLNAHLDSRLVKISHTRFEFEAMTVQSFFILLGKHPLVSAVPPPTYRRPSVYMLSNTVMAKPKQPAGPPMTLGNMREQAVH